MFKIEVNKQKRFFDFNQIDLIKDPTITNIKSNVPSSQKLAPRVSPPLAYSRESFENLKKILFQYPAPNNSGKIT